MPQDESLSRLLIGLGARRRGQKFILDGFDQEFYLIFDASEDPETPEAEGTCDILFADVGAVPGNSVSETRVVANCRCHQVVRFLCALGVERFSEGTRLFLEFQATPAAD